MKRAFLFILGFSISLGYSQIGGRLQIAVMPIEGSGIEGSAIIALTDRFRSELIATGHFEVMERAKMDEILTEQGFQQSGACTSNECLVEAGKMLGVEGMIASSIGKVGNVYTASARIIDIETGRVMLSKTEDCRNCPIDNMLVDGMRNLAQKLAGSTTIQSAAVNDQVPLAGAKGDFYFKSIPAEARVILDGEIIPGLTPNSAENVSAGKHVIEMKTDEFTSTDTVFLEPGEFKRVELVLKRASGGLKIVSQPFEAAIFIDDVPYGTTPKSVTNLSSGVHTLVLVKDGFASQKKAIFIKANETSRIELKLEPVYAGEIYVNSDPLGADVNIDFKFYGKTPKTITGLSFGSHIVSLKKEGFFNYSEEVLIEEGKTNRIMYKLNPLTYGKLNVDTNPAGATIFLDGEPYGNTPRLLEDIPACYHA